MGPDTWQEWLDVAHERMVDTKSMLPTRSGSVGPVYLAGYAAKLESWSTDLRCAVSADFPVSCEDPVAGASALVGFLQTRLRRPFFSLPSSRF